MTSATAISFPGLVLVFQRRSPSTWHARTPVGQRIGSFHRTRTSWQFMPAAQVKLTKEELASCEHHLQALRKGLVS